MSILLVCLTIVMFLPIILSFVSLPYRTRQFGTLDIKNPRLQGEKLEGAGQRTVAAQKNAWEALLLFVAAVAMALIAGVGPNNLVAPALLFVVARVLHGFAYIADLAPIRVVSFMGAIAGVVWIVVKAFNT